MLRAGQMLQEGKNINKDNVEYGWLSLSTDDKHIESFW